MKFKILTVFNKAFTTLKKSFFLLAGFLFILLFAFITPVSAQKKNRSEDVVYLKNGSIIHGEIIENKPGVSLRIKTESKSEWVFKYDEIEKITKEEVNRKTDYFVKNKGFYAVMQAGLLLPNAALNTNLVAGYKINRYLGVGVASGIDIINQRLFLPIALDVRGQVLEGAVSPYYALQTGYSIALNEPGENNIYSTQYKGGFFANPAAGVQISLNKDFAMLLEVGIRYQKYYTERQNSWGGDYNQNITIRRYNLRFGFIF